MIFESGQLSFPERDGATNVFEDVTVNESLDVESSEESSDVFLNISSGQICDSSSVVDFEASGRGTYYAAERASRQVARRSLA